MNNFFSFYFTYILCWIKWYISLPSCTCSFPGFKVDEIVQAWKEMYDTNRWQTGVPAFRLESLFRRRVSNLHTVLESFWVTVSVVDRYMGAKDICHYLSILCGCMLPSQWVSLLFHFLGFYNKLFIFCMLVLLNFVRGSWSTLQLWYVMLHSTHSSL